MSNCIAEYTGNWKSDLFLIMLRSFLLLAYVYILIYRLTLLIWSNFIAGIEIVVSKLSLIKKEVMKK